jgi:DNA polymerase-3 subunit alpha
MSLWTPLQIRTHFSLQKGYGKPEEYAKKCKEFGYESCAIADINTLSGAVSFYKACKKFDIKPLIGCAVKLDGESITYIAKNKAGWHDLIDIVTTINILSEEEAFNYAKEVGSRGNLTSVDHVNQQSMYYANQSDCELQRILLCSGMRSTSSKMAKKIRNGEDFPEKKFFTEDRFYLPTPDDIVELYTEEQIALSNEIADSCEEFDILSQPMLPKFTCPDSYSEDEYLKQLCRVGWKSLLAETGKIDSEEMKEKYLQRVTKELDIIFDANLSGYFLVVQDIVNHVRTMNWLPGPGRGSAAGCLVSYLVGITEIDPIQYGLIFERFYNAGRNTEDHVSLPDIDVDVPAEQRDEVIQYIKDKYGDGSVSQMLTFNKLQGRAALKEVMRIDGTISYGEMNDVTKYIPNEADISDQLQAMEEKSIIRWALINEPDHFVKWCKINPDGGLEGSLSKIFEQAINIEGTIKSQGKHAAGVIISSKKLRDVCPMVKDKGGNLVAGFEMGDLEDQGHVKFDILGIDLLNKVMEIKG